MWMPSIFIIGMIVIIVSCNDKPKDYSVLEFTGAGEVSNYSKSFFKVLNESDSLNPTALLAGNCDLIVFGNNTFLYYREPSDKRFSIKTRDEAEYINEKLFSLNIPDNDDMIPWFENMKNSDFSDLESINFNSKIQDKYLPYLSEIAKLKPSPGIGFSGDMKDMKELLRIFNPVFIVGPSAYADDLNLLTGLSNLELLVVSLKDTIYSDPLPSIPGMKQLFLIDIDADVRLGEDFLTLNRQVEKLVVQKSGIFDFVLLKPLSNLKELTVNGFDTVVNAEFIKDHKNLELLSVTGENFTYDQSFNELNNIRWISFSQEVSQNDFNQFIGFHPGLEVVEILRNETIKNLQPLSKLRNLYGLTISDTLTDLTTIKTLRNLRYLSLPESWLKDTLKKSDLQKSLPATRIVSNEGFCLGSGWLILIFPLVLLTGIFARRKKK